MYILPSASHRRSLNSFKDPGSHLLSHAVSSIVPSAVQVLTIVFGMGTGVSPGRIATRKVSVIQFIRSAVSIPLRFISMEGVRPMLSPMSDPPFMHA